MNNFVNVRVHGNFRIKILYFFCIFHHFSEVFLHSNNTSFQSKVKFFTNLIIIHTKVKSFNCLG
jgi:hypothetical protein